MSRMSDFDAELREVGIDPNGVDLDKVAAYRIKYKRKTGVALTWIEAVRLLYIGPQIAGWMRIV